MNPTVLISTPKTGEGVGNAVRGLDVSLMAHLAFARADQDANVVGEGRHLAFLPTESLELDLADPAQRQFGDYELLELIGEGGMGVVYRARQTGLDREVAVKLLSAGVWASQEFVERFRREAQNAARMQHPNIVPVYEVGCNDEMHFFSMRLIHGPSMAAELQRETKFAPQRAALLLRTIAEAVDYAHRLGVLHLDLKPANVLIDENGTPYVADFGLARRLDSALAADNDEVSGTPSYMAPEQASPRTRRITPATDIWGLGAILYELVTGAPPFLGGSPQATLQLVVKGQLRSARDLVPDLPRDLDAIIGRCMMRDAAERYPSARALADDLNRFIEGRAVLARPLNAGQRAVRWVRREPMLAATALLALVALFGGLIATTTQWRRADGNAATARERLWDARDEAALTLTESGAGWQAAPKLLANLVEAEKSGAIDSASGARKRLGIIENTNPRLIDVLAPATSAKTTSLAFSPDGRWLGAGTFHNELRVFDVASGKEHARATTTGPNWHNMLGMQFTPDGNTLQINNYVAEPTLPRPTWRAMVAFDMTRGAWREPPMGSAGFDTSFSRDGRYAVLMDETGRTQFWGTEPWRALSPLRKLDQRPPRTSSMIAPNGEFFATIIPGASRVALTDARTLVARPNIDLGEFGQIGAWAISADSRWLALGDEVGHFAVVDCVTRAVRRIEPRSYSPVRWLEFSDDGSWLAAAADAGGVFVWSWPEGRLLAPPFDGNPSKGGTPLAWHVFPDHARNRVLVSGFYQHAAIWQVAPSAFETDSSEATQAIARVAVDYNDYHNEVVAWQPTSGLLASQLDKRIRLERLPPAMLKSMHGAPIAPTTLRFDGRRLVAVVGRRVQLVDALSEAPLGAPFEFAQPPGFAELSANGASLVVASGRFLHVLDVENGKARFAAIALTNSPQHIELSPDGHRIVSTWLVHDADNGAGEMAEMWSMDDGHKLAGPVRLSGPLDALQFNNDGAKLLAWNRDELSLRDGTMLVAIPGPLASLHPPGWHKGTDESEIVTAAFGHDGDVWTSTATNKDPDHKLYAWQSHAPDGSQHPAAPWQKVEAILALPGSRRQLAVEPNDIIGLAVVDPDGSRHTLPAVMDDEKRAGIVASPDGRWLALLRRDGAALFDLEKMTRVATLRVALPRPDQAWQLAFSPDGNRLLARTLRNRYIVWNLDPDIRPTAVIARELVLRDVPLIAPDADRSDPDERERAALRAHDPGAPVNPPSGTEAVRTLPGGAIAARDPTASAELIDLTTYYNFGLSDVSRASAYAASDYAWLPQGVQRFLGVDYDVRGGIELRGTGTPTESGSFEAPRSVALPLGERSLAAVDALMLLNVLPNGGTKLDAVATLHFIYADGTQADATVRWERDLNHYFRQYQLGPTARLAALGFDARGEALHDRQTRIYAVRVANPQPQKPVTTLTLSAIDGLRAIPVFLALTIEPLGGSEPATPVDVHK